MAVVDDEESPDAAKAASASERRAVRNHWGAMTGSHRGLSVSDSLRYAPQVYKLGPQGSTSHTEVGLA